VNISYHGSSISRRKSFNVTTKMKDNVVPFMIGMHCFAHKTNITMLVLLKLSLVVCLEALN
jgi:hypothetical protein